METQNTFTHPPWNEMRRKGEKDESNTMRVIHWKNNYGRLKWRQRQNCLKKKYINKETK